jgi:hypothetical protein
LENGETYVGENSWEQVSGKEFDVMEFERGGNYYMEWKDIELDMGEGQGVQNCQYVAGEQFGVSRLEADVNYTMEWIDMEMETGEVEGQNFEYPAGQDFGVSGLDGNYGMEQKDVHLSSQDKRRMTLFKRKRK